jgi:pantetheine-phosphate adenylyltransferase
MAQTAIYPGSFDPLTNGHVNIIERATGICDHLVIAVVRNISKSAMFSMEERLDMLREVVGDRDDVSFDTFDGLLVDYARSRGARMIVRGLRAVADFEYEYQMANMNRHLASGVETVFLMADPTTFYVSSRLVKEVASLGGDITDVVPAPVFARMQAKLRPTT